MHLLNVDRRDMLKTGHISISSWSSLFYEELNDSDQVKCFSIIANATGAVSNEMYGEKKTAPLNVCRAKLHRSIFKY